MSLRINTPKTVIVASNPTPLPPSQDTQILTNVNNVNSFSYPGYNFKGSNMFPYFTSGSVDVSAIFVGSLNQKFYAGGVLAPNGRIYCIPCNATNVGIINPYNDTIDTTTITGLDATGNKYLGGVLAPNNKIYCIPDNATNVAIIDTTTNTIDTTTISMSTYPDLSGQNKMWGGVLASDGKIYCAPRSVSYVGIIDPSNNTFSSSVTFTKPVPAQLYQWAGGALGSNGNVYFCPFGADKVLRIRPTDNSLNLFGTLGSDFGGGRYYGSCTGPDGNIYCMPFHQNNVLRIGVSNEDVSSVFTFNYNAASNRGTCGGASLSTAGDIYGIPGTTSDASNRNLLFYYNPLRNTGGSIPVNFAINGGNDGKWFGGVLAPNGKIYMIPHQYSHVGIIKTGIPILPNWMIAREFNKF